MLVSNRKDIAATTAKRNSRTQKEKERKKEKTPAVLRYCSMFKKGKRK
jgi:hypothetical protein